MVTKILNIIQFEPDLKEVMDYIKKPLVIVEQLQEQYNNFSIALKNNITNKEIIFKIDNLIENNLTKTLSNYCNLSLKYRNENIVKISQLEGINIHYTAKELLLENIVKIIEEIYILESKFNENNQFDFLVNNRLNSDLGNQPEYVDGKIKQPESIKLDNQFDYDAFIKDKIGKESIQLQTNKVEEPIIIDKKVSDKIFLKEEKKEIVMNKKPINKTNNQRTMGHSLGEIVLAVSLISSFTFVCVNFIKRADYKNKINNTVVAIDSIIKDIDVMKYYSPNKIDDINNKSFIENASLSKNYIQGNHLLTPLANSITIETNKDKTQTVNLNDLDGENCFYIAEELKKSSLNFRLTINAGNSYEICNLDKNKLKLEIGKKYEPQ